MNPQLRQFSHDLFTGPPVHGGHLQTINGLHALFVEHGAVSARDERIDRTRGIQLDSGVAVNPVIAARCAFDYMRTGVFLRGIRNALRELLERTEERPLNILYAGCGPYALLALPQLAFFTPQEVQFTLLDVYEESLDSAKQLIHRLGVQDYFHEFLLEDAASYRWNNSRPLHAVISETMQVTLKRETQVAIFANLVPQLAPGGILLPELIDVSAVLVHREYVSARFHGRREDVKDLPGMEFPLGAVATLDRQASGNPGILFSNILHGLHADLPPVDLVDYTLELRTRIRVWKDDVLKDNDSGLTVPVKLAEGHQLAGKTKLRLFYADYPEARVKWEAR